MAVNVAIATSRAITAPVEIADFLTGAGSRSIGRAGAGADGRSTFAKRARVRSKDSAVEVDSVAHCATSLIWERICTSCGGAPADGVGAGCSPRA